MKHLDLSDGNQYAINVIFDKSRVLLQLNDGKDGDQVRVALTFDEAVELLDKMFYLAYQLKK